MSILENCLLGIVVAALHKDKSWLYHKLNEDIVNGVKQLLARAKYILTKHESNLSANLRVTRSKKEKRREFFNFLRFSTPNRAVLEPILADLDRLWEMRHWIPEPGKPIIPNKQIV